MTHCQAGNQEWNPEADTAFIEAIGQTYTAVVAATGTLGARTEIPADSNFGIVPIGNDSIAPDDSLQLGAVFEPAGDLVGITMTLDSVGYTLEILRDGATVTGLSYTFGTTAGDTLYLEIAAEELACGGESNPCLQTVTGDGVAMTSECWGLAGEALAKGVLSLGLAADLALTFTPVGWIGKIFGYGATSYRIAKAAIATRRGVTGANVYRNLIGEGTTMYYLGRDAYNAGRGFRVSCM